MRSWRFALPSLPVLSLATAACVLFAAAALIFAASPALVNAEVTNRYAAFAVNPSDVVIAGTVVGIDGTLLGIQEVNGDAPVAFPVASGVAFSRDGRPASLAELRAGDQVQLTVNVTTGAVIDVAAIAAPSREFQPSSGLAVLAALGLAGATALLIVRDRAAKASPPREAAAALASIMPRTGLNDLSRTLFGGQRRPEFTS